MCGLSRHFAALVLVLLPVLSLRAQESPGGDGASPEKVEPEGRLAERDRLAREADELERAGKPSEAIQVLENVLVIDREVLGDLHQAVVQTLQRIAKLEEAKGGYANAERRLEEVLGIKTKLHGGEHWEVSDARRAMEDLRSRRDLTPEDRKLLVRAKTLRTDLIRLFREGKAQDAISPAEEVVEIYRRVVGEGHPAHATSLNDLAILHWSMGEYDKAEPLYQRAVEIRRAALGEDHPEYASSLNNLSALHASMGRYSMAAMLGRQALETLRNALGEEHPSFGASLSNLAGLYLAMGEYAKAEPLFRQALDVWRKTTGEEHPSYATTLNNLALLYRATGEYAKAEVLLRQALELRKHVLGERHPDYIANLNNLAHLYEAMGEYSEAEPIHRQALAAWREVLGEENPYVAVSLNNLASLYRATGEYSKAEPLYLQAIEIRKKLLGEMHPHYALSLSELASLYECMGQYERAESLYQQALELRSKALGEEHPDYASSLSNLSRFYAGRGDLARAKPLCQRSLEIKRRLLDATFAVQSEHQQLRMTRLYRGTLDLFLSLSSLSEGDAASAYAAALAWKGAIFVRQRLSRLPRADPATAGLFAELESAARRLATLCLSPPEPRLRETRRRQLLALTEKKDSLERELSQRSEGFRELLSAQGFSPPDLQSALPPGSLLVDILEYGRTIPGGKEGRLPRVERHVLAFLVPAEGGIRRVELGPAKAIATAVDDWLASVPRMRTEQAGRALRAIVWKPISEHLDGVKTLLVSPDGALNRLPLSALPGEEPGSYLIEEVPVSVIPVPRLLPVLLSRSAVERERESLLLVGDVEYGGTAGGRVETVANRSAAGTVTGTLPRFGRLEATGFEVNAIRDSFLTHFEGGAVEVLRSAGATEAVFREKAPRFRWIHLATHGFFAPPSLKSALEDGENSSLGDVDLVGYHPGLLSGLALAGANTPPEPGGGDDGILTALEVASLDLSRVEMAVLSACETGLGEVAGGEGMLGLQRGFQVAGAASTVASLWSVPDQATRLLMDRFYANLWDRGMGKLEALREAQLWLMREGAREESDVARGLGIERARPMSAEGRLPPYFWAGWVLSGDWR